MSSEKDFVTDFFRISPNMKNGFQYARSFKSNSDRKIAGEIEKNEVWFLEAIIDQLLVAFTPCPRQCMLCLSEVVVANASFC